jgi:peptide/nickel transport system ATP-binding protein
MASTKTASPEWLSKKAMLVTEPVLAIRNLKTYFSDREHVVRAVDGIDIQLFSGETLCVVGESGCGKSMTALSVMGLVPRPAGKIVDGQILFEGRDLTQLDEVGLAEIRGNKISMIFQEPMTCLNPLLTIGDQISEPLIRHKHVPAREAVTRAVEMLKQVGIPRAESIIREYPHQLSGGMRQRAMIAMAMICSPKILIADEPTTALDVTIQMQILELMRQMRQEFGTTILFITHDLGVVAELADQVLVMYAGQVVETASADALFERPLHPYASALLASIPFMDMDKERLYSIPGVVSDASRFPDHCRFADRCERAERVCFQGTPELEEIAKGHRVRCYLANRGGAG